MSKLLFLDLETSGLEEKDRICEIAFILENADKIKTFSSLCKSPKKIGNEAMSLHHITNDMIKESPLCKETLPYQGLLDNNSHENVLVSHNSSFDLKMLEREGFDSSFQIVDTLRCTKALIPECEIFKLQYLRYELLLYKDEKAFAEELDIDLRAHRALSDALHTQLLYRTLLQYATLSQLIDISAKPVLMSKLLFGKYSGRYIEEIASADIGYLNWLLALDDIDEDLAYSIRHYI